MQEMGLGPDVGQREGYFLINFICLFVRSFVHLLMQLSTYFFIILFKFNINYFFLSNFLFFSSFVI